MRQKSRKGLKKTDEYTFWLVREYRVHGGHTSFDYDNFEINVFIDDAIK